MCSMSSTECVVYENISKRSKFLREIILVLCFFCSVSNVFKEHNLAVLKLGCHSLGIRAYNLSIFGKLNLNTEILRKSFCNGSKAEFRLIFSLRSAEVWAKYNLCTVLHQILDSRKSGNNSLVISDFAVFKWNVKVATSKNFFAFYINVFNSFFV